MNSYKNDRFRSRKQTCSLLEGLSGKSKVCKTGNCGHVVVTEIYDKNDMTQMEIGLEPPAESLVKVYGLR